MEQPIYTRNNISKIMQDCLRGKFPDQLPEPEVQQTVLQKLGNWVVGLVK